MKQKVLMYTELCKFMETVWLRAAQTAGAKTPGNATKARHASRFSFSRNIHLLVLISADFSLRGCVNPASWLSPAAGTSLTQPHREKYALHSMYRVGLKGLS